MRFNILIMFGAGLVILGFPTGGKAQTVTSPVTPPIAETGNVTLSSESLQGVTTRSITSDFLKPTSTSNLELSSGSAGTSPSGLSGFTLQDRVKLVVERSNRTQAIPAPLVSDVNNEREQRFQVQYQLSDE